MKCFDHWTGLFAFVERNDYVCLAEGDEAGTSRKVSEDRSKKKVKVRKFPINACKPS